MSPDDLAEDLSEAVDDLLPDGWMVVAVHPPLDLSPERTFLVELLDGAGRESRSHLPAGLVAAYFGDEEGAVDHVNQWLDSLGSTQTRSTMVVTP